MDIAALYVRYSPRPDDLCESLEVQEDRLRKYFAYLNIPVGPVLRDPETSARHVPLAEREGGAELLRLTTGKHPECRIVGACRLDRLWRDVVDGILTLQLWQSSKVACHFADEGGQSLNTTTATGRFIVNVLLAKAAYEPDLSAERTSQAMLHHQSNGRSMSSIAPYGKTRIGKELVLNEEEQANITYIIELHRKHGMGQRAIARWMNASGYRARGKKWSHGLVGRILAREGVNGHKTGDLPEMAATGLRLTSADDLP